LDKSLKIKPLSKSKEVYLKVDGKYFGRWGCVLVFKERQNIILWDFVQRESYFSYLNNFSRLERLGYKVLGITSDWHGSITSASKNRYPDVPHQRCLVHTQRFCQTYLTQHPETEAGIQLLEIVKFLNQIKNINDKVIWTRWLQRFEDKYKAQLNERSYAVDHKHWWYTHKNVRRSFRALKMSLSNLFLYLDYPLLCKDTNGLEAEFKHLKQKLAVHKGLTRKRKINFINWYFFLKSKYYQKYHTF